MLNKTILKLRAEPKQPVQINRPVVLSIGAAVTLVVLLSVIHAFNTTATVKTPTDTPIKVVTDKPLATANTDIQDLPSSYTDVNNIKKYVSSNNNEEEVGKLQRQVEELRGAYVLLEDKLRNTKPEENEPRKPAYDPKSEEAKGSKLVFAGLEGGVEGMVAGGDRDRTSPFGKMNDKQTGATPTAATPEQEKFYKQQAENDDKLALMKGTDKPDDRLALHRQFGPISKYQLKAGSIIPATLNNAINTTVPGSVIAQVRQNIYDSLTGKYLLIPMGSKLLGEYDARSVRYGVDRITVMFTRLIRPDGADIVLDKPIAYDLQGNAGMVSKVDNHWGSVLGAAIVSTALSVGSAVAGGSINDQNNKVSNRLFSGISSGVSDIGNQLTSRAMSVPPTITVEAGSQFNIILKKDLVFSTPYNKPKN